MLDRGHAPGQQLELPFAERRGEASVGASGRGTSVGDESVMERVVARGNLLAALARVKRNRGSPGPQKPIHLSMVLKLALAGIRRQEATG